MNLQSSITSLREDRATYTSDLKIPSIPVPMTFVHGAEVRIALSSNGRPMLLLPVSAEELRQKLPEAGGLTTMFAQYKGTSYPTGYFLQVSSKEVQLDSVFLDLVENICRRVQKGEGSYSAFICAMEDFKHLLNRPRPPIDRSQIIGLVGELLFLRRALSWNPEAVIFWTGPQKARRDFLFPRAAVEIKTSEQAVGRTVVIHSLAQLESSGEEDLFLVYYRLEEKPMNGITVTGLVEDIRKKLIVTDPFEEKLQAIGFSDASAASWDIISWALLEEQSYEVSEGFPRLIPDSFESGVPLGISNVNYQLDLDSARKFIFPIEPLGERLKQ